MFCNTLPFLLPFLPALPASFCSPALHPGLLFIFATLVGATLLRVCQCAARDGENAVVWDLDWMGKGKGGESGLAL
ncbi:hypothetical protein EDC01DRAFT_638685, partial [Geopyxis carbonaria]